MADSAAVNKQAVSQTIFATIDEINETRSDGQKLEKSLGTPLFGREGRLDSLGLVNFVISLEQNIAEEFGVAVTLADEKALSRETSPFLTVDSLSDYIVEQLRDSAHG